jgi:hypothetical protein
MSRQAQWRREKVCEFCGRSYLAARSDSRSCSPACKKALQRGSKEKRDWCRRAPGKPSAGTVPFMAAVKQPALSPLSQLESLAKHPRERDAPRNIVEALMKTWPSGTEVYYQPDKGPRKAGRINWNTKSGRMLQHRFKCCYSHVATACVPVETLIDVQVWYCGNMHRA